MPDAIVLVCRECGAPLGARDLGAAMCCPHCRATTPLDAPTHARLQHHAAHLRRADQKVRAILRQHVIAALLPQIVGRTRTTSLALVAVGMVLLVVGCIAPMSFAHSASESVFALALVVGIGGGTVALVGSIALAMYLGLRAGLAADQTASAVARSCATRTTTTRPARCGRCGGYAAVVVMGDAPTLPCPWCRAPLVCERDDALRAAMDAITAEWQATGDARLARARAEAGTQRPRPAVPIAGFVQHGYLYEGLFGDVPVWACGDINEFGLLLRVEAQHDTAVEGSLWFLPRGAAETHGRALTAFGLRAPAQRLAMPPAIDSRFEVWADVDTSAARLVAQPEVWALLMSAGPQESVILDEAGASCWWFQPTTAILTSGFREAFPARAQRLAAALTQLGPG